MRVRGTPRTWRTWWLWGPPLLKDHAAVEPHLLEDQTVLIQTLIELEDNVAAAMAAVCVSLTGTALPLPLDTCSMTVITP